MPGAYWPSSLQFIFMGYVTVTNQIGRPLFPLAWHLPFFLSCILWCSVYTHMTYIHFLSPQLAVPWWYQQNDCWGEFSYQVGFGVTRVHYHTLCFIYSFSFPFLPPPTLFFYFLSSIFLLCFSFLPPNLLDSHEHGFYTFSLHFHHSHCIQRARVGHHPKSQTAPGGSGWVRG